MNQYKVKRPFVDYGMYHPVDEIITDVSIISNKEVKLHGGTLVLLRDGVEVPFDKIAYIPKDMNVTKPNTPVSEPTKPKATVNTTKATRVVVSTPAVPTTPKVKVVKTKVVTKSNK